MDVPTIVLNFNINELLRNCSDSVFKHTHTQLILLYLLNSKYLLN